jgi:hypothetical protein
LGPQPTLLLVARGHLLHEVDIAFVGRMDVERCGSEPGVARLLEDGCLGDVAEAEPPHLHGCMWREQAGGAGAAHEFGSKFGGRAVAGMVLTSLDRDDLLGNEAPGALLQFGDFR